MLFRSVLAAEVMSKRYTIFGAGGWQDVVMTTERTAELPSGLPEAERVAATIREQIIDGTRLPGSKLVERDLAAELGTSRVPVREALSALVVEGLVTPRPRTWAVVRTFDEDDVHDLLQVRSALETLAFRLAAERATPAQLEALGAVLAREEGAAEQGLAPQAHRAAGDFHALVSEIAASPLLTEISGVTASRMRWMLGQHRDLALMAAEHRGLLEAIRAGDADRAGCLAARHLRTSAQALDDLRAGAQHPPEV